MKKNQVKISDTINNYKKRIYTCVFIIKIIIIIIIYYYYYYHFIS